MVTLEPSTEMNILWLTKEACEGYVEYGPTPALGNRAEATLYQIEGLRSSATPEGYDPTPENNLEIEVYQLIANLENLEPGSVVYYRVTTVSGGEEYPGNRYFFKTAPESGEEFDFALLSDMQLKVKTKETLKFLGQQNKDFILFAGDLSNTPWKVGEWFDVEGYYPVSTAIADPEDPSRAIYPDGDYCWDVLRPIYEAYGVDAVNFGHSHVYERYRINDVNYIEAASIGNNYRGTSDPYHPSGNLPIVEENNFRSIMLVHVGTDGMTAKGIQASMEENGIGYIGRVFDAFTIAE